MSRLGKLVSRYTSGSVGPGNIYRWMFWILLACFAGVFLKIAWICDDAFITFRTVDNFINGYGLRWNIDERVQTYTHPLWTLLIAIFSFFSREQFYTTLIISLVLSIISVGFLIGRGVKTDLHRIAILALCLTSVALMHYTSSGLENPLSNFLAGLFLWIWFKQTYRMKIFHLALVASLASVNRHDSLLIYIPCLIYILFDTPFTLSKLTKIISGFFPLIIWTIFSLLYYGFPFPNTAYAKLKTGIPDSDFLKQGTYYFIDSIVYDPITLSIILFIVILTLIKSDRRFVIPMIGVVLYLLYILRIGGDFMSGRFFALPFYCSLFIFSRIRLPNLSLWVPTLLSVAISVINFHSPIRTFTTSQNELLPVRPSGIADERNFYYRNFGLLNFDERSFEHITFDFVRDAVEYRNNPPTYNVAFTYNAGITPYYSGREIHFVDFLTDPLLSRLPIPTNRQWRVGHYYRPMPPGYKESLETGVNRIQNIHLAKYHDKLVLITRGPILSASRLKAILWMNLGKYNHLLPTGREVSAWSFE